jgi:transcriptional regulator with AAA-type ATPase domain
MFTLEALLGELSATLTFEDAAQRTLEAMLAVLHAAAAKQYPEARVLRARVHVRPFDGYSKFYSMHPERVERRRASTDVDLPSHGAWEWISKRRAAVAFDVQQNSAMEPDGKRIDTRAVLRKPLGEATMNRLIRQEATHVLVVPLLAPGAGLQGMVDIDVQCRRAIGTSFIWPVCGGTLATIGLVAAPYLVALPRGPLPEIEPDKLLPVVGPSMKPVIEMLERFARAEDTLLLTGPTGVGKSKLARWCHARSRRGRKSFESLDLATNPEELQMGEIFGAVKGAYTGASATREGAVSRSQGGTLFIDEVDKLSLKVQAGLLKLIEEREFRPLGGETTRTANVRFIVGTNANLWEAVAQGTFREDLYFRINVLPVRIPSLDERADEIASWAKFMAGRRHGDGSDSATFGTVEMTPAALELLEQRRWPGNLRQLDNVVRRAYVHAAVHAATEGVTIDESHVLRALQGEANDRAGARQPGQNGPAVPALAEALDQAAEAFLQAAFDVQADDVRLDLSHATSFADLVLLRAAEKKGKRSAAERLLSDKELAQGNYHRRFRRAEERWEHLRQVLAKR